MRAFTSRACAPASREQAQCRLPARQVNTSQHMKLIGYPSAGRPWDPVLARRYSALHLFGGRVGLLGGLSDITGNLGTRRGARVVHDELSRALRASPGLAAGFSADMLPALLGPAVVHTSAGRAASVLRRAVGVYRRGPRKGQVKWQVIERTRARRGRVLGKRARAVGAGRDAAAERARQVASWLAGEDLAAAGVGAGSGPVVFFPGGACVAFAVWARRRDILCSITAEHEHGARLLAIAERAARAQAERLRELRGVRPSETSIDDAAADAAVAIVRLGHRLASFPDWLREYQPRWRAGKLRLRSPWWSLYLRACRAAFLSLCSWARAGMTGDNTVYGSWGDMLCEATEDLRAEDNARDAAGVWWPESVRVRRSICRWVYAVGLRDFARSLPADMRGAARAAALRAARARCRVVGALVFGVPLADALTGAGFASRESWADSCRRSGFWQALRAARLARLSSCPGYREARANMRAAALDAAAAVRDMRAAAAVWAAPGDNGAGLVRVRSGAAAVVPSRLPVRGARRVVRPAVSGVRVLGVRGSGAGQSWAWLRAAERRAAAVERAVHWRDRAARIVRDGMRDWERALSGLKSDQWGDLRRLFGFAYRTKAGRVVERNATKRNPAGIGRARGKVARPARLAPTVAVELPGGRKVAAAVSVSGVLQRAMLGERGFTMPGLPAR